MLAHNPSRVHLLRHADLSDRRARGRGDRSRARICPSISTRWSGDRRAPGGRDHVHPHPPRPQPGGAAAGRARPARRSSAARRSRWRRSGRARTRRSTAIMRRTGCSRTASARGRRQADHRRRDARPHVEPSLLRLSEARLFSGDHVMGWSTTVVVPPDGDMAAYMRSLDKLRQREDRIYYPAHGPAVTNPQQYVRHLIGHRMQREKQILQAGRRSSRAPIPDIVANAYPGLDPRLVTAAGGSVLAHLVDLERRGLVEQRGEHMDTPPEQAAGARDGRRRAGARRAARRHDRHRRPHLRRARIRRRSPARASNRCARRTG